MSEQDRHPGDSRRIVVEPTDNTAGLAVMHRHDPGPHQTEYVVEQLWPDGRAEPVHVGDSTDALHLIEALAEVLQRND